MKMQSAPGQSSVTKRKSKSSKAKKVSGYSVTFTENGGVSLRVSETYVDPPKDNDMPFLDSKEYAFSSKGEADEFINGLIDAGSPEAPDTTMGDMSDGDLDDAVSGIVMGHEQPDTYKSMRS